MPSESKILCAVSRCRGPVRVPGASTIVPFPIAQGVFGIARITAQGAPKAASISAQVTPAAIEMMS